MANARYFAGGIVSSAPAAGSFEDLWKGSGVLSVAGVSAGVHVQRFVVAMSGFVDTPKIACRVHAYCYAENL